MRIKSELKDLFTTCNSNLEIFNMIATARAKGFDIKEVNVAASWRKNNLAKEASQTYRKLRKIEYTLSPSSMFRYAVVNVENPSKPYIQFTGEEFVI